MKQIGVKNVKLSEYEMSIAAHLVDPLNMHVCIFNLLRFFLSVILCRVPKTMTKCDDSLGRITGFSIVIRRNMIYYSRRIQGKISRERGT